MVNKEHCKSCSKGPCGYEQAESGGGTSDRQVIAGGGKSRGEDHGGTGKDALTPGVSHPAQFPGRYGSCGRHKGHKGVSAYPNHANQEWKAD